MYKGRDTILVPFKDIPSKKNSQQIFIQLSLLTTHANGTDIVVSVFV